MRFKTWPVAALGLGSLLLLIVVSMLASSRKAQEIYTQLDQLNTHHHNLDAKLRRLRSDVNLSGIFVRDYLLDVARERGPEYRERLAEFRRTNMATVAELRALAKGDEERISNLQTQLDDYWETFDPLFDWTLTEKIFRSAGFLRREVVPRREAVLTIAQEIEELNNANLARPACRGGAAARRVPRRSPPVAVAERAARPRGGARLRVPAARARAAVRRAAGDRQRGGTADAPALAAAGRRAGRGAEEPVARAARPRRAGADGLADGARPDRADQDARRRAGRRGGRRMPRSSWTACSARSGISRSACGRACSTIFGLQAALEWHVRDFTRRYGVDVELEMAGRFRTRCPMGIARVCIGSSRKR